MIERKDSYFEVADLVYRCMEAVFPERARALKFEMTDYDEGEFSLSVDGVYLTLCLPDSENPKLHPKFKLEVMGQVSGGYWDPPDWDVLCSEELSLPEVPLWFVNDELERRLSFVWEQYQWECDERDVLALSRTESKAVLDFDLDSLL